MSQPSKQHAELHLLIDEQAARLPEKYRMALVLCDLTGMPEVKAAKRLETTPVELRLRRTIGSELLAKTLARRGVAPALTFATLGSSTCVHASTSLIRRTVQGALTYLQDSTVAPGLISGAAAVLAQETMRAMWWTQIKTAAAVAFLVVALGLGSGFLTHQVLAQESSGKQSEMQVNGASLPQGAVVRLGTTLWRDPQGTITKVAMADDGKSVVVVSNDETVLSFDVATGKPTKIYSCPEKTKIGVLSSNGQVITLANQDGQAQLYDLAKKEELCRIGGRGMAGAQAFQTLFSSQLAVSRNAKVVAMVSPASPSIQLLDGTSGKELRSLAPDVKEAGAGLPTTQLTQIALSDDGRTFAVISQGTVSAWDATTGKKRCDVKIETDAAAAGVLGFNLYVGYVACSGNGNQIAYLEGDGSVLIHDTMNDKPIATFKPKGDESYKDFALSETGKFIAIRSDRAIVVHEVATQKELHQVAVQLPHGAPNFLGMFAGNVGPKNRDFCFSQDEKFFVAGSGNALRVQNLEEGKTLGSAGHVGSVVQVRADKGNIVTLGSDLTARVWNKQGEQVTTYTLPSELTTACLANGHLAYAVEGKVVLLDAATGKEVRSVTGYKAIDAIGIGLDGARIAVQTTEGLIHITDKNGKEIHRLGEAVDQGQAGPLGAFLGGKAQRVPVSFTNRLVFSPDGAVLAVLPPSFQLAMFPQAKPNAGPRVELWNVDSGKQIREVSLQLDMQAEVPDAANPMNPNKLLGLVQQQQSIVSGANPVVFSADGRTLAAIQGNTVIFLETLTGKERGRIAAKNPITSIAFSPKGSLLTAVSGQSVLCFDMASLSEVAEWTGHGNTILDVFHDGPTNVITASADSTALVWDLGKIHFKKVEATGSSKEIEQLWNDLAGDDAAKAYRAIVGLSAQGEATTKMLKDRLQGNKVADDVTIKQWIKDMDSEDFRTREKATADLVRMGKAAEPALREALKGELPSLELRRRVERLVEKFNVQEVSDGTVRTIRAIETLERIASVEAREILGKVAEGLSTAVETIEAKRSLERMQSK